MSTYRPTVRYSDDFRSYIDSLFHATTLDRSQILRAALFAAARSKGFQELLKPYRRKQDAPLPSPAWEAMDHVLWLEAEHKRKEGVGKNDDVEREREVKDSSEIHGTSRNDGSLRRTALPKTKDQEEYRRIEPVKGRTREIPTQRVIRNAGNGIRITIG